jgi:hypothetical protein
MPKYRTHGAGNYEHVRIVEQVLGHKLPAGARVHHLDGNGLNNDKDNLVVCPNESYHKLLHIRQDAMAATGDYNQRHCTHCGQYDKVSNLKKLPSLTESYYHRSCDSARRTEYNRAKRGVK